jgi:hypothetical protein
VAVFVRQSLYTSEDLKWDAPFGRISNQHWNPTLAEIKCPILNLQGCKYTVSEYPTVDFGNIDRILAMRTLDNGAGTCHTGVFVLWVDNCFYIVQRLDHSLNDSNRPIKNNL